ncbi:MAG: glycosyltransferase family 4 protein [Bacteroidales bacterium]|nr:glycosyltransferase family 4 protein [Bacteroidales bacterium]
MVPSPTSYGGVANYYSALEERFSFFVKYFYRGVRRQNSKLSRLFYPFIQALDYLKFTFMIILNQYDLVHINTSFGKTGLIRDYFFIKILQFVDQDYIIFFRGIDEKIIKWIESRWLSFFRNSFLKAGGILVLSRYLKNKINSYNYSGIVAIETTVVDPFLTNNLKLENLIENKKNDKIRLLFLSRLEKSKGIYETINAFKILKSKGHNIELYICGDGSEFTAMSNVVKKSSANENIIIKGHVQNKTKIEAFLHSDIYLFPSSHKEGLPNALLEAMAFGLPIITSDKGGISDFFQNTKMGFMTGDLSPKNIAGLTEILILDSEKRKQIREFNYGYAKEHFYADRVVKRLEDFYYTIICHENHIQ